MQKVVNTGSRRRSVANALASVQIEKLQPSDALKRDLDGYVDGRKTITEIIDAVLRRHDTLRRA